MRTDSRCRKLRHIAPGAASYGTVCGRDHLVAALWLPTGGYREHRQSGYIEATAHAGSVAYARKYAVRSGGFLPTFTNSTVVSSWFEVNINPSVQFLTRTSDTIRGFLI